MEFIEALASSSFICSQNTIKVDSGCVNEHNRKAHCSNICLCI